MPTPETFPQACRRLLFEARDRCVKSGGRITGEIIEQVIADQVKVFRLMPAKAVPFDPAAESIFAAYPRREGKKAALKAISVALRTIPLIELLKKTTEYANAVKQWPDSVRFEKGRDHVPFPQKWFNEGRYLDDPSAWVNHGKKANEAVKYDKF